MINQPQTIAPGFIKRWIPQILALIWRAPITFGSIFALAYTIAQFQNVFLCNILGFVFAYLLMEVFFIADTKKITPQIYLSVFSSGFKAIYFYIKNETSLTLLVFGFLFVISVTLKSEPSVTACFNSIFYWAIIFMAKSHFTQYMYPLSKSVEDISVIKALCYNGFALNRSYCLRMENIFVVILIVFLYVFINEYLLTSVIFIVYIGTKYMAYREVFMGMDKNSKPQEEKSLSVSLAKNG